eukprot:5705586-Prorocentrum_lima.AAC.1
MQPLECGSHRKLLRTLWETPGRTSKSCVRAEGAARRSHCEPAGISWKSFEQFPLPEGSFYLKT